MFDRVYSLVRDFTCLPPALKFNLVETLRSNLSVLLPNIDSLSRASMSSPSDGIPVTHRIASHRNALKIYSFFLLSIVVAEESGADSCNGPKVIPVQKLQFIWTLCTLLILTELIMPCGLRWQCMVGRRMLYMLGVGKHKEAAS